MTLRITTANTDWAKRGDAEYIAHLCSKSDVVLVQEAKDTDLAAVAPKGWTALQDKTDLAHMGTGILVRNAAAQVGRHGLTLGVNPFLKTGKRVKMLARHIYFAHLAEHGTGDPHFVVSAHFPPHRFSLLQPLYRSRLAALVKGHPHTTIGTDANQPIEHVAKALGFEAYGRGIIGLLAGPGVRVSHMEISSWGIGHDLTDHPSVTAVCESVTVRKSKPKPTAPHGFMPGAIVENITPGSNDPAIIPAGVLEHIAVSNSPDIRPIFTDGRGIESHFYVEFDGTIRQYRSVFFEADAQFAGNSFFKGSERYGFVSVENEGGVPNGGGTLTPAQLASFKRIVLWVKSQADFPLRVCPAWNAAGVGYHSLFPEWNADHHTCPGPDRIEQFHKVIVPWLASHAKAA